MTNDTDEKFLLQQRVKDLEDMIDIAIAYIKSGKPGIAAIILIGSKPYGFHALQDAEREAAKAIKGNL